MILLCIVIATGGGQLASPPAVSYSEVRSLIEARGPRIALGTLFHDDAKWDALLDHIATGQPRWLTVARLLRMVSDAHASETLDQAAAEALPKRPEAVLAVLDGTPFEVDLVCGSAGFAEFGDTTQERILAFLDSQKRAVEGVRTPSLRDRRAACLAAIESAYDRYPE